jgi:acetylglutamate kinase
MTMESKNGESHIETVLSTLTYLKKLSGTNVLVKIGGSALTDLVEQRWIFEDLQTIRSAGIGIVLVHGGGPMINAELKARGISWEFVDGQRVTTPEMMEVIESVLYGTVNRHIVRGLNLAGIPAVGISGIESSTLMCKPAGPQLGKVGEIQHVDTSLITSILKTITKDGLGTVPVIAPIGISEVGDTVNINADWVASRVAQFLGIKKVLFITDQDGILGADGKVLSELDASELDQLIESGQVTGGMLTKTRTILSALRTGVDSIHIINAKRSHALVEELFTETGIGTVCRLRSHWVSPGGSQ